MYICIYEYVYYSICIYILQSCAYDNINIYIYTHRLPENPQIQDTTIHSCPF